LLLAILFFTLRETGFAYSYLDDSSSWFSSYFRSAIPVRNIVALVLVALWAMRLGGFLLYNRVCRAHNDRRYETAARETIAKVATLSDSDLHQENDNDRINNTDTFAVPLNPSPTKHSPTARQRPVGLARALFFFFQFLGQALLVLLPATPLFFIFGFSRQTEIEKQWSFWVGLVLIVFGMINHFIADIQIQNYKTANPQTWAKGLCREGWWKKSRHPNLFFDVVTWLGFAILGIDDQSATTLVSVFGLLGPLFLFCIMRFITIPLTEQEMQKRRPNWEELIRGTNVMWPF
jgi:steroid 5-alpha reductase family enzyme